MKVAVVGSGVSGLVAAHRLAKNSNIHVKVYDKEDYLGGHARTVSVDNGSTGHVDLDLGFMVFNRVTYPNMMEWFEELGVEVESTDMSISTRLDGNGGFEWSSRNSLSSLLEDNSNTLSHDICHLIHEILNFNTKALKYLEDHETNPVLDRNETLGHFIQSQRYSKLFQDAYLIPMCACIWSSPLEAVLDFPAFLVFSYCRENHHLQLLARPQWFTVKGRSQSYVYKVRRELERMGCQIKTSCEVKSVSSCDGGYKVLSADGCMEMYDQIVFGVHAPDALKILGDDATRDELRVLGAFQYTYGDVYLHCDESFMPQSKSVWSARNFQGTTSKDVCVTYWLNLLQNTKSTRPYLCTINPPRTPNHVLLKWYTAHYIPSVPAANASLELSRIQGKRGIWFCGAYQGYGFHEDGVKAGNAAAAGLLGKQCTLLVNPKSIVPSWTEDEARSLVGRFLDQYISIGSMGFLEGGGATLNFGEASEKCHLRSVLQVHDPKFYWKIATGAHHGFADAYINGYFTFHDSSKEGLLNLLLILIANRDAHKGSSSIISKSIQHNGNAVSHYNTTMMHWRESFIANRKKILAKGFDDKFIRAWEYYFIKYAAGFMSRTLEDYQDPFVQMGNVMFANNVIVA